MSGPSERGNKAQLVPSPLLLLLMRLLYYHHHHRYVPELTPDLGSVKWAFWELRNQPPEVGQVPAGETKNAVCPPWRACAPHGRERPRRSLENASPSEQGCQKAIHNSLPNGASGGRHALGAHSAPGTLLTAPHMLPHCIFTDLQGAILPLPLLYPGGTRGSEDGATLFLSGHAGPQAIRLRSSSP